MTNQPVIDFIDCEAPDELVIEDFIVGEGVEVTAGQTVTVHYVGVECDSG